MKLSAVEVRAAYYAAAWCRRAAVLEGRLVPPDVAALERRLDVVRRVGEPAPVSRGRQSADGVAGESDSMATEWIGTRLAAGILGWDMRRVQRHAADINGRLVGGRLIFPAAAVREYREHYLETT